ncbi:tetratricopeptide repeat protein [Rhodovulum strictum]|uniref:Tetratricopeptide repeat protein n=1 Tax=Rhodovulum strictum TaxID=58314 RepID=A0A844B967_9RHOB|nr:hypothetical protein [Rhodovulum strictum]MRH20954.1 hypothetical protein [Rhodovulum strictum]
MPQMPGSQALSSPEDVGSAAVGSGIGEQVERLLRAGVLEQGSRRHRLLDYLIAHNLSTAPGTKLKEYAIAVDVLGRTSGFDPATDGIVRVEIARLRKALDAYFDGQGRGDPLALRIPKGQYEIEVVCRSPPQQGHSRPASGRLRRVATGLVALAVAGAVLFAVVSPPEQITPGPGYPLVRLEPIEDRRPNTLGPYPAAGIAGFLANELSHYRSLRVTSPGIAGFENGRSPDFLIGATLQPGAEGPLLSLNLMRGGDRSILWSTRLALGGNGSQGAEALQDKLDRLVVQIGGPLGVIESEARARLRESRLDWHEGSVTEFQCYLMWQSYDLTKDAGDRRRARDCLRRLTDAGSGVGQIWAAAAFMQFLDWVEAGAAQTPAMLDAALRAANRAVLLDPNGSNGYETLGSIMTALGRFDEASAALERAAYFNPSHPEIRVRRGWLFCLTGDWDKGVELLRGVVAEWPVVPGWYRIPLALDAFQRGDQAGFATEARRIVESGDPRGLVLALAAARLSGDLREAARTDARLEEQGKTVARALEEIAMVFPDPPIIAALAGILDVVGPG